MLSSALPLDRLRTVLLPREDFLPYPTASNRDTWDSLPVHVRNTHIERGLASQSNPWPTLTATGHMHYYRTGDYMDFQKASFARRHKLRDLVTAECAEGQGRFTDDIVDGIWCICEESFWGVPPNTWVRASEEDQVKYSNQQLDRIRTVLPDVERPGLDLWVGETAGVLAWTAYLLRDVLDDISPLICDRITHELKFRALDPCLERNFLWMGFLGQEVGNWNPWCNSNWLTCILLHEQDEERRIQALDRSVRSLDNFLKTYAPDGGCNEGPGYWGRAMACLFDCIELINLATNNALDIYADPLIREMCAYIYRVHIDGRYFVNFADAPGNIGVAPDLVYRLGNRAGDDRLKRFGVWAAKDRESTFGGSLIRELPAIFNAQRLSGEAEGSPPLVRDAWLPDIQVLTSRSKEGTSEGLYLAVKGGHNREHHNHNDVGNFIVYTDGLPAIIDAGVGTYTRQNSGPNRYDIWTMKSGYHNLPTIGGIHQGYGREFSASVLDQSSDESGVEISLNITRAWPEDAKLSSWIRTLSFDRHQSITLNDAYKLTESQAIELSLITPCAVSTTEGRLTLETRVFEGDRASGALDVEYDSDALGAEVETIDLADPKLNASWGDALYRIVLRPNEQNVRGEWTICFRQPS